MDAEGYFFRSTPDAQAHATAEAAASEMDAQVQRALAAGIDVTHIDTHMGSAFHPKLLTGYVNAALKHRVPPLLLRLNEAQLRARGNDEETAAFFARALDMLEGQGLPMLDHLVGMPLDKPENRFEQVCAMFDALPAGISYFIIHPSHDTPEARAMGPDWPSRAADYATFMDERVRARIKQSGLHVIGWRELREVMRAQ
jgi:chitin disaccharide deacetylase